MPRRWDRTLFVSLCEAFTEGLQAFPTKTLGAARLAYDGLCGALGTTAKNNVTLPSQ